ncbi:MAG TPA: histidine phosphatase family protein [Ktedonobacteraceae bacterium]|nr:histidine phosphatase family protein [Ktedonobacteraceae bacterium]
MPTTRLFIVRHGETLANREFRFIGSRDDPLSEPGQIQAGQLAEALAVLPIAAVYSSPLQRAWQTARPIAERLSLDVQKFDALRECGFGVWEGMSRAEILARSPADAQYFQEWEHDANIAPPGGESMVSLQQRVCSGVEQLVLAHPDQSIVLVSHVGPIKALMCAALGVPISTAPRIFLDPATISVVDWRDMTHSIVRLFNSHTHLGWQQARWMQ